MLQRDKWNSGFNGMYGPWVANFGKGAYTTTDFASTVINYAFASPAAAVVPVLVIQGKTSIIPSNQNETALVDLEFQETDTTSITGLSEYGFGYWFRWLRTGPAFMLSKNTWHTMSRLTATRNHGEGDKVLNVYLGPGYF